MKKLLLTGTAGFIMGNFIRKAIYEKQPYHFISIDKITNQTVNNIYHNKSHTFYIGDVADSHFMDVVFNHERPDLVIHGAAETSVDVSLNNPNNFVHSNVLGTQVVINNCIKYKVEKLLYISTDEVGGHLTSEHDLPWKEDIALNPRNPYSASKAAGELLVKAAHESHGLNYNITRSSNNYGPRQTCEKLIPRAIKCILNNQKIPIYGKGLQLRDWTYVTDNVNALLTVLRDGKDNEIYNISANQECSNIELIQKICNIMGKGHQLIEYIEDPRKSHDFRYAIDCSKLKTLGWKPEYNLPEGLIQCVSWYNNNQWFLK